MKQLFKFAGAILDAYDDPAFINNVKAQPLFGKTLITPDRVQELPDECFAVKIASRTGYKKRFPIYNEDVTKISCLYFDSGYDQLPEEIQKTAGYYLSKACDKFGIEKRASIARHTEEPNTHVVDYVTTVAKEPVIASADDLAKLAEFRLACEIPKMVLEDRTEAATALFKAAGEDRITRQDVWDYVAKPVTGPMLEGALDDREAILKRASRESQYLFEEVRNQIEDAPAAEVVEILKSFDKYAGLDERYQGGLIDPYKAVYGGWPIPSVRKRNAEWEIEKEAQVLDGQTGQPLDTASAKNLSVAQHLFNLQAQYPKNTGSFVKAAQLEVTPHMEQKWGPNYVKARKLYFGV